MVPRNSNPFNKKVDNNNQRNKIHPRQKADPSAHRGV